MEYYLNILHFCFYKAHYNSHLFANKINPFNLLHKLPFLQRRYKELGIDIQTEIDKAFGDKNFGLSVTVAGGIFLAVLFFFFLSLINLFIELSGFDIAISFVHFIPCGILSIWLSYIYVFKKDKYIMYFDKFEKWTKPESLMYCWFSFCFIILTVALLIFGIIF